MRRLPATRASSPRDRTSPRGRSAGGSDVAAHLGSFVQRVRRHARRCARHVAQAPGRHGVKLARDDVLRYGFHRWNLANARATTQSECLVSVHFYEGFLDRSSVP